MSLKRDSPVTLHGGRGVAMQAERSGSGELPVARGGGGVSRLAPADDHHRRQDFVQEDLSPQASPGTGPTPVPATVGAAVAAAHAQQAAAVKGGGISAVPTAATTIKTTSTAPVHTAGREGGVTGQPAAGRTHGEPAVEYRSGPELYSDRPSLVRESREMLPGTMDKPSPVEVEKTRISADNTAGYDAGTAARGGGTGGTTEAMTGGLAAGGAIGDERRQGMGDIARGQL
ncbi:hypothetical protein COHA_003853 [Chlorella ohadii]|uniref:Uncharacterized protein n=1 Tax=Chlorella ohadii TaxID=2649997 RepID=A0AAD5DU75_9CHLO|nr:hypothetical protein COHA_003853 [Chlorella ohadii]